MSDPTARERAERFLNQPGFGPATPSAISRLASEIADAERRAAERTRKWYVGFDT